MKREAVLSGSVLQFSDTGEYILKILKLVILLLLVNSICANSQENYDIVFAKVKLDFNVSKRPVEKQNFIPGKTISFTSYMEIMEKYETKKQENLVRRAEIIFFGSLTLSAFASWLFMSLYNTLIYQENFGNLNRNQFLLLYFGAGTISISVSITDLLIKLKPKMKGVEIY